MKPSNQYDWNVTRKFSWGHIVAFVALIFMSYVMYMGTFYSNGGNFLKAALVVGVIDVLIAGTFIGAQLLKGTDHKFDRCIIMERILICLCPVVFVAAMIPYNHFWGVYAQRHEIERQFNQAIAQSGEMFDEYERYADDRLENYRHQLERLPLTDRQRQNYYLTLELQLRGENQKQLAAKAREWIDKANTGASVWNAFLIGNLGQIRSAVETWEQTLDQYSAPVLSNELPQAAETPEPDDLKKPKGPKKLMTLKNQEILSFSEVRSEAGLRTDIFEELEMRYQFSKGVQFTTIWTGLILFAMLLLPYLLQARNTRAHGFYHLWPWGNGIRADRPSRSDNGYFAGPTPHGPVAPPKYGQQAPPAPRNDGDLYSGTM